MKEIPEWEEDGEVWRRLRVRYPPWMDGHCRQQIAYFDKDGLLRRHDCVVDILGGAARASYPTNYSVVSGLRVPMTRQTYGHDERGRKLGDTTFLRISVQLLDFHRAGSA